MKTAPPTNPPQALGLGLVELLVVLALLGLLLPLTLALTRLAEGQERRQRILALMSEDLSLAGLALAREAELAGYRVEAGEVLEVGPEGLWLSFFCERGMEAYCPREALERVRTVGYSLRAGRLLYGACNEEGCDPSLVNPVLDGVEAFKVAYRQGGVWRQGEISLWAGRAPGVEMLAFYLLVRAPYRAGGPGLVPGQALSWPPGLSPRRMGLPPGPLEGGYPRAERLLLVPTPNLAR